jgi:hypothetical protein
MKENVIIVKCEVPSEAYQILTTLRKSRKTRALGFLTGLL